MLLTGLSLHHQHKEVGEKKRGREKLERRLVEDWSEEDEEEEEERHRMEFNKIVIGDEKRAGSEDDADPKEDGRTLWKFETHFIFQAAKLEIPLIQLHAFDTSYRLRVYTKQYHK